MGDRQVFRLLVMGSILLAIVVAGVFHTADTMMAAATGGALPHVGKSFIFDYGDFVLRVRYLSDNRLEWEQLKGPQAGLKGEEQYGHSVVRSDVVFFWWQEKDRAIVTQVVDFGSASVHTTYTSPDSKLSGFQGKVEAQ